MYVNSIEILCMLPKLHIISTLISEFSQAEFIHLNCIHINKQNITSSLETPLNVPFQVLLALPPKDNHYPDF